MISCFLPRLPSTKKASCRDCPCDSSPCRDSRQEAKSHGQSLQEAIYRAQQSRQEARDRGQSQRKPNMTDSLCRKRKLADSLTPCVLQIISDNLSPMFDESRMKLNDLKTSPRCPHLGSKSIINSINLWLYLGWTLLLYIKCVIK